MACERNHLAWLPFLAYDSASYKQIRRRQDQAPSRRATGACRGAGRSPQHTRIGRDDPEPGLGAAPA